MIYQGTFKNINEETIEVTIHPTGSSSTLYELQFVGDNPVTIAQVSDGLFSPIKSRTCTVRILSDEPIFDFYSSTPTGVKLTVTNTTTHLTLFEGYVTPFNYNQSYISLDEISIEAVDSISVLKEIKYTPLIQNNDQLLDVAYVLKRGLIDVAGYNYRLWVPKDSVSATYGTDVTGNYIKLPATVGEKISESAFKDENDEYMSWYEIIEEICRFYCLSCTPSDGGIYFIDYKLCRYYDIANPNPETVGDVVNPWRTLIDISSLPFVINNGVYSGINLPSTSQADVDEALYYKRLWIPNSGIVESSYRGSDQTIEIDECYNNFVVKPEIEEYKLDVKPIDDMDVARYFKTYIQSMQYRINGRPQAQGYKAYIGVWQYYLDSLNKNWDARVYTNSVPATFLYVWGDNFTQEFVSMQNARRDFITQYGDSANTGNLNDACGQCVLPCRYYTTDSYNTQKAADFYDGKSSFNDILVIPTGAYYLSRYYNVDHIITYAPEPGEVFNQRTRDLPDYLMLVKKRNYPAIGMRGWYNEFYTEHFGGNNVLLTYTSDEYLSYAPNSQNESEDIKSYLIIKGDILYQVNTTQDDTTYNIWGINNYNVNGLFYPISELGYSGSIDITNHASGTLYADHPNGPNPPNGRRKDYEKGDWIYNTDFKETNGWPLIKMSVQIGDYYWNGTSWQTTATTFFIDVCKFVNDSDPDKNGQRLILNDWMQIQRNYTYADCIDIDSEGYAIPIDTKIRGKMTIKFYMPKQPFYDQIPSCGGRITLGDPESREYNFELVYNRCTPAILMKNFEILHYTAQNSSYTEGGQKVGFVKNLLAKDDEDITYERNISSNYINKMEDIDLKFNTINEKKPVLRANNIIGCAGTTPFYPLSSNSFTTDYTKYTDPIVKTNNATPHYYRQELNILDRYVEHYSTPKKIYNCQINGYMVPLQCFEVHALPNTRFVLDTQEWDVKSDVNNVKLVEY